MLDINKYRKINEKAKDKQQELEKQIQSRIDRELNIIESVADSEIAKDESTTDIKIKMDLHSRTVDELTKEGFTVDLNSITGEFIISWNKTPYDWNGGVKPIKKNVDERTVTKDEDISFSMTGGNDEAYFVNGVPVTRDEYKQRVKHFIEKFGLPYTVNEEK